MWIANPEWSVPPATLTALVVGSILINTANQTLIPAFNLLEKRFTWMVLSTLSLWFGLGFSYTLTAHEPSADRWIAGQLTGLLIGTLLALWPFTKLTKEHAHARARPKTDAKTSPPASAANHLLPHTTRNAATAPQPDSLKGVYAFALPLILTVGLNWAQFQSYRLYLGPLTSIEFLGLFAGAYTLATGLMSAFENLMQQFFYPRLYRESHRFGHKGEAWRNYASVAIPLSLWAGLLVAAGSGSLIRLMLAKEFHGVTHLVLIAVTVETLRVAGNVYSMAGHVALSTKMMIKPQAIGATIVLVGLTILLRQTTPELALAATLLIAGLAYVVASHFQVKRSLEVSLEGRGFRRLIWAVIPAALAFLFSSRLSDSALTHLGFVIVLGLAMLPSAWLIAGHALRDHPRTSNDQAETRRHKV
jgi:hypothetical protein